MRTTAGLLLILVLAACTGNGSGPATDLGDTTSTSSSPTSTLPPVVECPGVGGFEEGGGIAEFSGEGSDSSNIGRISWETNDQCETFHLDFVTSEGAPATTVPGIRVDHLETFQVLRIRLDVDDSIVTDQLVETTLVDRLYVVRSLTEEMFVDLHLAEPAAARASFSSSPARLSIELRPGFVPFDGAASVGENIVLTSPGSGTATAGQVRLGGYARTTEGEVLAVATQDGEVVAEGSTTTADSPEMWGEYGLPLGLPPGEVSVFLGEETSENGSLTGITVDLTVN